MPEKIRDYPYTALIWLLLANVFVIWAIFVALATVFQICVDGLETITRHIKRLDISNK